MYIYLVLIIVAMIAVAIANTVNSTKGLDAPENPAREKIAAFFRDNKAVSAETAISNDTFPIWLRNATFERNVFKAMLRKKIVVKSGNKYYLDEGALKYILGK